MTTRGMIEDVATSSSAADHGPGTRWSTPARWFDAGSEATVPADDRIDWVRCLPFIGIHLLCLGVWWTGVSTVALLVAVVLYLARVFSVTAFYHRYFSHRTFKTS